MSGKERRRVGVLATIKKGKLSLAKGATAMESAIGKRSESGNVTYEEEMRDWCIAPVGTPARGVLILGNAKRFWLVITNRMVILARRC